MLYKYVEGGSALEHTDLGKWGTINGEPILFQADNSCLTHVVANHIMG